MMRLPNFRFVAPTSVHQAAELLAASSGDTMLVAGGTDLLPNMKRRQQAPGTLVGVRHIAELRAISSGDGVTIGAGLTLTDVIRLRQGFGGQAREAYGALWQAAAQVATPQLRNMGTLGGNLCLDTRCNYYDQNYEWRKAIDFCMKKDGETCWVAPSSPKCVAVSSTDTAPALLALGASVTLVSANGTRQIALSDMYRNDGIHYLTRQRSEILTSVHVPRLDGWRSVYWKLRRRGAFDFPVLSVAAAAKIAKDGTVEAARIVLGAVASRPVEAPAEAIAALVGRPLTDDLISEVAERAAQPSRPLDNTDFTLVWRKRMTKFFVSYALKELRGDDMRARRLKVSRQELL
ncbi:MAG: FAD binding domain-containing protein [Acidobacteriia bacterium]|nr:FAD binding domain-containing protein [Terriglobia bacterium]